MNKDALGWNDMKNISLITKMWMGLVREWTLSNVDVVVQDSFVILVWDHQYYFLEVISIVYDVDVVNVLDDDDEREVKMLMNRESLLNDDKLN